MVERVILHIDFDSFFASVEQQYQPRLRDKPIGVTATNGRTCIIAASKEAKKLGIKTASRTYDALKICPSFLTVPADFEKYWEVSKKFIRICTFYTPSVEIFSIDEVFMDVTHSTRLFGGVDHMIVLLKRRIRDEVGPYITVSIGISYNKLLAKLASGLKKPDGVMRITKESLDAIYQAASLTDICGIGERINARLARLGITSLLNLRRASLAYLTIEFGPAEARFLYNIARGIDQSALNLYTNPPSAKSVSRNYCLPHNEYNQRVILQNIFELSEEIGIKLRKLDKKCRTVGLSLRGNRSEHGRKTVSQYINAGSEIFAICNFLYNSWGWGNDPKQSMVRMMSVWAGNLEDARNIPATLFDQDKRNNKLYAAIDELNKRYGDHTIRNGYLLYVDKLTTVPNGYMADRYERSVAATAIPLE